jgi:hypothetical protein
MTRTAVARCAVESQSPYVSQSGAALHPLITVGALRRKTTRTLTMHIVLV